MNQDDPSGHCGGTCDSAGACKSKLGQSCTTTSGGCIAGSLCAPDGHCCTQSCGTDATCAGTCAGRADGSCLYPTSACGTPTCSGTTFTAQGTCTNGSCAKPTPTTCGGGLVCGASACKTYCAADTDCASTISYCSASETCLPKASAGTPCTLNDQCTSGICSGGVCACPQPSSGNVVPNAGFDKGLSPWSFVTPGGTGTVTWTSDDASGCPKSGAASLPVNPDPDEPGEQEQLISPCINLSPSTNYNFGAKLKGFGNCTLYGNSGANCTGTGVVISSSIINSASGTAWSNASTTSGSGNAQSANIVCEPRSTNDGLEVDMIYVTLAPGGY